MAEPATASRYDLVLKGGRVIDERNGVDGDFRCGDQGRQDRCRRALDRSGRREGAERRRLRRRAGPHRHPHPRLPQGDLAQRRSRAGRAARRDHDADRCGQRRRRQLRRLPRLCDGAFAVPHPRVPQHLVPRHLRLRQGRADRRGDGALDAAGAPLRRQDRGQSRSHHRGEGPHRRHRHRRSRPRRARAGARGRERGRPAADGPHRPSAAELLGRRRHAAAGRHPDPLLPPGAELRHRRGRQGARRGAGAPASAACSSTSPTAWAPSATRPQRRRSRTGSSPTSSRRTSTSSPSRVPATTCCTR